MHSASKNLMTPQEYFASVQTPKSPRSSFDRSCELLTTMNAGILYPIFWDEVLPSSTWNVSQTMFARINTLIKPLMDNLYMDFHWFFVPNRLIWTHWVNFMGENEDQANPVAYTIPQMTFTVNPPAANDLANMLGLPIRSMTTGSVSALPFRAYKRIYDDYYRDENLIPTRLTYALQGDATVNYNYTDWALERRAKRKDYFTSALPWAQKGTAPTMTLGTSAPLKSIAALGTDYLTVNDSTNTPRRMYEGGAGVYLQNAVAGSPVDPLYADLSSATGFTLNAFREFVTIQQFLELDARGGTRYVESLHSQFGVQPEDARLNRSEYLGGQTITLATTPIAQTSESSATLTPQGNLAGMGTFSGSQQAFVKSFTEDGIIMCFASVRSENRYQQGVPKKFTRTTRYDFYRPVFANLGEQPILNSELWFTNTPATDAGIWGYQEAWAEYRYSPSQVTGFMASDSTAPLDVWHLAQDFASLPALGQTFIEEMAPIERVVNVVSYTAPAFTLNGRFNLNVAQPMPTRSTPGLTRL